ncbi:DNA mismatch repair endonuclease MutL [Faunimonas sp. B44]|uniref:DNA mismatch repair endonuclease MutL n=1 Tax=Faunimonas sp. B44 TaxID=3461493 RepID=UPI00404468CD
MAIRVLPDHVVNRIAAGEVVERPASVVKELVENAIDAGARRIEVVTAGGGKSLVRVADDGCGIARADLPLALARHCTSKLRRDDLSEIGTLGFRGEALASIGAVARLAITTRHADEPHAWTIAADAGRVAEPRPASHACGTTTEVRDLFFATPARLKFLRSDRAEASAVADVVKRLALAHPGIRFILAGADRNPVDYPALGGTGATLARMGQVLGADFADNAMPVFGERDGVRIEGFAGLPTLNRANSLSQFVFVNGRPLRDPTLAGALRAAYADVLARDRYPVLALFLDLPPAEVDVNVHPAKLEVRFRDPGLVRGLIIGSIRDALAKEGFRAATSVGAATLEALRPGAPQARAPTADTWRGWAAEPALAGFAEAGPAPFAPAAPQADAHAGEGEPPPADYPLGAARAQIHGNYIVAQTADGLVIVDQHAAHERIVYEKLKAALSGRAVPRQMLLIPEIVDLPADDVDRILARAGELAEVGLAVEGFGPGAVAVTETPALLGAVDAQALLRDIADDLAAWDASTRLRERLDHVAATMACHGSVRSGRRLKPAEMDALLREMEATPQAGQCNHGRPTYVELKLSDIERLFGRR